MSAWDRLDTENDLFVLTGLLFEWLEHLRTPVIGKDAMTYVVIHCDDIEKAMSKVSHTNLTHFSIYLLHSTTSRGVMLHFTNCFDFDLDFNQHGLCFGVSHSFFGSN